MIDALNGYTEIWRGGFVRLFVRYLMWSSIFKTLKTYGLKIAEHCKYVINSVLKRNKKIYLHIKNAYLSRENSSI